MWQPTNFAFVMLHMRLGVGVASNQLGSSFLSISLSSFHRLVIANRQMHYLLLRRALWWMHALLDFLEFFLRNFFLRARWLRVKSSRRRGVAGVLVRVLSARSAVSAFSIYALRNECTPCHMHMLHIDTWQHTTLGVYFKWS